MVLIICEKELKDKLTNKKAKKHFKKVFGKEPEYQILLESEKDDEEKKKKKAKMVY